MNGLIGLILSGLALLINIVGLAIPYWWYATLVNTYIGLWQICGTEEGERVCIPLSDVIVDSKIEAVRAMELLGLIGMVIAILCVLAKMLAMKENEMLPKVAGATAICSGILMIVGVVIFATIDREGGANELHAGFALCIVAGIMALPAGVFDFINK